MTIDDELLLELIKPDRIGKIGKEALVLKILANYRKEIIGYKLEESTYYWNTYEFGTIPKQELVKMTPDITVAIHKEDQVRLIAIELENDIHWDFGESLRQLKRYKGNIKFFDTIVIIPYEYKRFAPLYKNEGLRVWLWRAKRKWQCLRCETITVNESRVPPQCKNEKCKNKRRDEFDLVGLENADFNEYE